MAKYAVPREIKGGTFLEIVRPVRSANRTSAGAVSFDGVLISGSVDHTQIIKNSAGLGTFAGAEEAGHRDRGQQRDDCNNDHDFHEGEAAAAFIEFVQHVFLFFSV